MRPLVVGTVVAASLAQGAVVFCQDTPAQAPVAQPAAAPTPDVFHQEELTGDRPAADTAMVPAVRLRVVF